MTTRPGLVAIMLMVIASCAKPPQIGPAYAPLPGPERCQDGAPVPPAPRSPRTVEQLGAWALTAQRAARQTERARAACATDYERLRQWAEAVRAALDNSAAKP
jgi:hypothetical protein